MNTPEPSDLIFSREEVYKKLAGEEDILSLQVTKEGFRVLVSEDTEEDTNLMDLFCGK